MQNYLDSPPEQLPRRSFVGNLQVRISESSPLIQVILGPRQVGKTTGVMQLMATEERPFHYASADDTLAASRNWILEQWQQALLKGPQTVLVIDEIQKIHNWAETIKGLWDQRSRQKKLHAMILLGSSSLTLQKGLTESLTGRFEVIKVPHWGFAESASVFGYDLNRYLTYGGYPGAHRFEDDYNRWFSYLKQSVVETVIGQDILTQTTVAKPALFRQVFEILCGHPAQIVSYQKLVGQLQDKGSIESVKHYIELYQAAFLFETLEKYAKNSSRRKASSPKIVPMCPALFTLSEGPSALDDPDKMGFLFEAAVGMELSKLSQGSLFYWRESDKNEVDFILTMNGNTYAIEVKSGRRKSKDGLNVFLNLNPEAIPIIITPDNFPNFASNPGDFLRKLFREKRV